LGRRGWRRMGKKMKKRALLRGDRIGLGER